MLTSKDSRKANHVTFLRESGEKQNEKDEYDDIKKDIVEESNRYQT